MIIWCIYSVQSDEICSWQLLTFIFFVSTAFPFSG